MHRYMINDMTPSKRQMHLQSNKEKNSELPFKQTFQISSLAHKKLGHQRCSAGKMELKQIEAKQLMLD